MTLTAFATGVAQLIDGAGIGVWNRDYTSDQALIVLQDVPTTPDRIISLTAYTVLDDLELNDSMIALQVRTRGDTKPSTVMDTDDAIFALLHGLHDATIGGVPLAIMRRVSALSGPKDANQRWERASNYYASVNWPTAHRPD